tara:strand:- start:125 stop:766 length:642 start_codon:yes stop_codon:yes gene_type:complete
MDSKSKIVMGITALSLILSACAGTHNIKQEATFQKDGSVNQVLNEVPQWYIDSEVKKGLITNRDADQFIYGVGTSVSPDLQLAINKATMVAKADLADQINGELSARSEQFVTELGQEGNKQVASRVEETIINTISATTVVGYDEFAKDIFITKDQNYRVYVGLKWGYNDNNKLFAYISDDVALKIEAAANVDELAEEAYDKVMAAPVIDVEVQ